MNTYISHEKPRITIAAPASGQGKTTLAMGIMAALTRRGKKVQPFKVGPDYIDPAFHTAITGRNSINLDLWLMNEDYLKGLVTHYADGADIAVIEGVMGLYDGFGLDGMQGSTAEVSKLISSPVVLVIQVDGMASTAAALVSGMKHFGACDIKAVIVNKPSSEYHYELVKRAIESRTDMEVIGYLPESRDIELKSRHLGLVQSCETDGLDRTIEKLAYLVEDHVDIDRLLEIVAASGTFAGGELPELEPVGTARIAVARDEAFNFYYHENFEMMKRLGADLVFFSPIHDSDLPADIDGIYIGGGYPEVFAEALSNNMNVRMKIKELADKGMPIFAECGGYMYLNADIQGLEGPAFPAVGIFEGNAVMTDRLQNFGYLEMEAISGNYLMEGVKSIAAHEFHRSKVIRKDEAFCIKAYKGRHDMIREWTCGMQYNNVFGMYPHIYFPANTKFVANFVEKCSKYQYTISRKLKT